MVTFLTACLHVLLETAVGLAFLTWLRRHDRGGAVIRGEDFPTAFLLGLSLETGLLGVGVLNGFSIGVSLGVTGALLLPFAAWAVRLHWAQIKGYFPIPSPDDFRWYEWIAFIVVLEKALFGLWNLFRLPQVFWDALVQWGGRGHAIYGGVNLSLDPQSPFFMTLMGKKSYPWGTPLWQAATAVMDGGWSDDAARLLGFFFFFAIVWLGWAATHRMTGSRPYAAAAALILAAFPLNVWHLFAGYADIGVAAFSMAALAALIRREWLLVGLLAAGAAWQKNEGMMLFLPALAAGALFSGGERGLIDWRALGRFLAGAAAIVPWLLFKLTQGLPLAGAHGQQPAFQPEAAGDFLYLSIAGSSHGGFWVVWIVLLAWFAPGFWRSAGAGRAVLIFCLAFFAMLVGLFLFTNLFEFLRNQMTGNRLMLQFFPAALLALVLGLARREEAPEKRDEG